MCKLKPEFHLKMFCIPLTSPAGHRSWNFTVFGPIPTSSIPLALGALRREEMLLLPRCCPACGTPWGRAGRCQGWAEGQRGRKWLQGSWALPILLFHSGAFAPLLLLCHTAELCVCLPCRNEGGDWLVQPENSQKTARKAGVSGAEIAGERRAGVALLIQGKDIAQTCPAFPACSLGVHVPPSAQDPTGCRGSPLCSGLVTELCKGFVTFLDGSGMGEKKKWIFLFYALFLLWVSAAFQAPE